MIPPAIDIKNLTLIYHHQLLFSNFNLTLPSGQWVSLLGPSGVGKSSLLRMMAGLKTDFLLMQGHIDTSNGLPISQQAAYMAQHDLLLPWLTTFDNTLLGLKLRPTTATERNAQKQKALALLEEVGLMPAKNLYPAQLSGGMRQRVALVRTLMEDKPIVLMDEPFSALDALTRYKLQALAYRLLQNKTVLFITHDPMEALRLSHFIYIIQGQPAILKQAACLTSPAPRDLTQPDVTALQPSLFRELMCTIRETS